MASTHLYPTSDAKSLKGYQKIQDYAIIGDLQTVALVGKNGSIDWFCLPDIASASVFGKLLDCQKGGFFSIDSTDKEAEHHQLYYPDTNILLTRIATPAGMAEVTDFMPVKESRPDENGVSEKRAEGIEHSLIRQVFVTLGEMKMTLTCRPAFNYAHDAPRVRFSDDDSVIFKCSNSPITLTLSSSKPLRLRKDRYGGVTATFTLRQGEQAIFLLNSVANSTNHVRKLNEEEYRRIFWHTFYYWNDWLDQCTYQGRWREIVHRSALVLKLLTYHPTGAIVAAATTSLPEAIGGDRNWDYRYTWLRDAAFTLDSLLSLGFTQEARDFMEWLNRYCCDTLEKRKTLQPMYGIHGEKDLEERTLDHLNGYAGSHPVRIGNGAYTQTQLDIYGELLDAIFIYNRYEAISYDLWDHIVNLLEWLSNHWREPDKGIWEVRGGPKEFLHSRLMSWVAFDRAIRIARTRGWPAPLATWERIRTEIYKEIMENGVNKQNEHKPYFTQSYDSNVVDASTLLTMLTNFVGPHEPLIEATIDQIQEDLSFISSILRYNPQFAADDGLERSVEGAFSACSFWFVECQARAGSGSVDDARLRSARLRLEKLLSLANHVGLYAEEIDGMGHALGNFPQAFTHLALIRACLALNQVIEDSLKRKH